MDKTGKNGITVALKAGEYPVKHIEFTAEDGGTANSRVTNSLIVHYCGSIGDIADSVYKYSTIADNAVFKLSALKKLFVDPENGDYTLRDDAKDLIGFEIDMPDRAEFGRR